MSEPSVSRPAARRNHAASGSIRGSFGISTLTATSIIIAALITGLLLSINAQEVARPFLICFVLAAIVATATVETRGLFLTVAQLPLAFGIFTPLSAWLVSRASISGGTSAFSKTMLLTALYPLAQYFPYVAGTTALCILIAIVRWRRAAIKARQSIKRFDAARARRSRAEAQNRSTTTRVRELSSRSRRSRDQNQSSVTVDELVRNAERRKRRISRPRGNSIPPRRDSDETRRESALRREATDPHKRRSGLGDDLYS